MNYIRYRSHHFFVPVIVISFMQKPRCCMMIIFEIILISIDSWFEVRDKHKPSRFVGLRDNLYTVSIFFYAILLQLNNNFKAQIKNIFQA